MIDDVTSPEQRARIDRALKALRVELDVLDELSMRNLTVRVRASQATAERIRQMAHELRVMTASDETRTPE